MKYNDRGPAFPGEEFSHFAVDPSTSKETPVFVPRAGMSLRDYFAAKAMQGLLSKFDLSKDIILNGKTVSVAQLSYMYSDSMLEAREK